MWVFSMFSAGSQAACVGSLGLWQFQPGVTVDVGHLVYTLTAEGRTCTLHVISPPQASSPSLIAPQKNGRWSRP